MNNTFGSNKKKIIYRPSISTILSNVKKDIRGLINNFNKENGWKLFDILNYYRYKSEYEKYSNSQRDWIDHHVGITNDLSDQEISKRFLEILSLISECSDLLCKNLSRNSEEVTKYLHEIALEYKKLSHYADTPNDDSGSDDFDYLIDTRENLHALIDLLDNSNLFNIEAEKQEIKKIDNTVRSKLSDNKLKHILSFSYIYPKSHWWWHLHEIGDLTKEELETI